MKERRKRTHFVTKMTMFVVAFLLFAMPTVVSTQAASTSEKKIVVEKIADRSEYTSCFASGSVFGTNFGYTLENEAQLKYKVYFTDGTYSELSPSNCEALKVIKELKENGTKLMAIVVLDCDNAKKRISIIYVLDNEDGTAMSTMVNFDGTYCSGYNGYVTRIQTEYDESRKGLLDVSGTKTEMVNGVEVLTANIDNQLSTYTEDYRFSYVMDIKDRKTNKTILKDVDNSFIKGNYGDSYYFCQMDSKNEYVALYKVYYKSPVKASLRFKSSSITKTYGDRSFVNALSQKTNGALSFKSSNTAVATVNKSGRVTIKGVGNTKITLVSAQTDDYLKAGASYILRVNPKGTTVSKLVAKSKGMQITLKKQTKQVSGYQIQVSLNKNFSKAKLLTVKSYKKNVQTVKKLKAKKKYYVRVRTYKKVSGRNYVSSWSKYKTIKTKK